jgi:hypothetical protein
MKHLLNPKNSSDGAIGLWFHTYCDDGDIDQQFQVVRRSGNSYLCLLYSWEDGRPSYVVALNRDKVLAQRLYQSSQAMNRAFELHEQGRKREHQPDLYLIVNQHL